MNKIVPNVQESGTEFQRVSLVTVYISNDLTLGVHRRHYIMTGYLFRVIDTGWGRAFIFIVAHRFVSCE